MAGDQLERCPRCAQCETCGGTGQIMPLTLKDKIARHLMLNPQAGLAFDPAETLELAHLLGLAPTQITAILGPDGRDSGATVIGDRIWPPPDTCYCNGRPHVHMPGEGSPDEPG